MSIGSKLREARENKGLSTNDVAMQTRMIHQMVEEIEVDNFSRITAAIYGRGFIRLYAECVGIDPAPLVEEFNKVYTGFRSPSINTKKTQKAIEPEPRSASIAKKRLMKRFGIKEKTEIDDLSPEHENKNSHDSEPLEENTQTDILSPDSLNNHSSTELGVLFEEHQPSAVTPPQDQEEQQNDAPKPPQQRERAFASVIKQAPSWNDNSLQNDSNGGRLSSVIDQSHEGGAGIDFVTNKLKPLLKNAYFIPTAAVAAAVLCITVIVVISSSSANRQHAAETTADTNTSMDAFTANILPPPDSYVE